MNVPSDLLYKYRAFDENGLKILINRELYFASPESLNDPLDYQVSLSNILSDMVHSGDYPHINVILKLLWVPKITKPETGKEIPVLDFLENRLKTYGVLSLSKNNSDALLWSHYAGGHKGFTVGFHQNEIIKAFQRQNIYGQDVRYGGIDPIKRLFQEAAETYKQIGDEDYRGAPEEKTVKRMRETQDYFHEKLFETCFRLKSSDWEYEEEYRFVKEGPGLVAFQPEFVKEIIFGMKMTSEHKRTIRNVLKGSDWQHIEFKTVRPSAKSFGFQVIQWD